MECIPFPECNREFAPPPGEKVPEDLHAILSLPCHLTKGGIITTCYQMTRDEMEVVAKTGRIWVQVKAIVDGKPFVPLQRIDVNKPI